MKKRRTKNEQISPHVEVREYIYQLREENAKRQSTMQAIFDRIDRALDRERKTKKS